LDIPLSVDHLTAARASLQMPFQHEPPAVRQFAVQELT